MNKKKKSTNTSPYPDEVIDRLARAFYPAILACWNSEEGQREFAAWQAEQAHLSGKEKQEVPAGELPVLLIVCGFLQGASGRAHPVFVLPLIFQSVTSSHVPQILLRLAVQNQFNIRQRVIVDKVVQFSLLETIVPHAIIALGYPEADITAPRASRYQADRVHFNQW